MEVSGVGCQVSGKKNKNTETSVFVICIFYSFNTSPSLLSKLFSFVPVYSLVFPGYTIKRVGFGKSPYVPYPIETSLDLPHPCRSRRGGALFVAAFDSILFRLKAAPSECCRWEGDTMVTMKRPTIKLLVVSICSYMLLFAVSSSPRAEEPLGSTATFYVQWYDVGKKALEGLEGVNKVTRGFRGFREINTVYYDPTVITFEEMEDVLKKAGTYVETKKSP